MFSPDNIWPSQNEVTTEFLPEQAASDTSAPANSLVGQAIGSKRYTPPFNDVAMSDPPGPELIEVR